MGTVLSKSTARVRAHREHLAILFCRLCLRRKLKGIVLGLWLRWIEQPPPELPGTVGETRRVNVVKFGET